ncbi:YesL family protein [Neobacillus bataviensis]|uniref:YesL family protein n=1 Tax=Neobacillus bataviensis TaxID=220685 RepID=UPI001CC02313|nr:YesL family protein [Neobacillus bataviensis]
MKLKGLNGFIYRLTELIMNFAYLQLLWLAFTIVGLGVFGIFPSTAAMFSVVRKWVMGVDDTPIFQTFWQTYKTEFIKVNGLGFILVLIGWLLYVDYHYFSFGETLGSSVLKIVTILIAYFFITTCIYFFPIYVHFQFRFFDYFKYSFLYSVASPLKTAGIFIITYAIYFLLMKVPALFLFFSGSIIGYIWMWYIYRTITKSHQIEKE